MLIILILSVSAVVGLSAMIAVALGRAAKRGDEGLVEDSMQEPGSLDIAASRGERGARADPRPRISAPSVPLPKPARDPRAGRSGR
jgi:hypothetical protein